jgi:starch synthase
LKKVLHISTECYPAAKAGGMGDVVGALPIYLPQHGIEASVIIPKYKRPWFKQNKFKKIYSGTLSVGENEVAFNVQKLNASALDFPFYCVDIPGLFDRENIYLGEDGHGYKDEAERNIAFQVAILEWLIVSKEKFDLLHCHDHMTGLIPFFIKSCIQYKKLNYTPTIFTIHNGQYRGIFNWDVNKLLPPYDPSQKGLLEWDDKINSLACAIKCAWRVSTVSPSYMKELRYDFDTLTPLLQSEQTKCTGVINGIDNDLWDPATDKYLDHHLENENWTSFKALNKADIIRKNNLKSRRPLFGFIGRLAYQKGADILAQSIENALNNKMQFSTIILGSGDKQIEQSLIDLAKKYPRDVAVIIAYDEKMARSIYAGSDFLLMPSRFEPCGLNQMYAMRYSTIPIVSNVGGLKDTVPDILDNGNGIVANKINEIGFGEAINRSITLFKNKAALKKLNFKIRNLDWSWNQSAKKYTEIYKRLLN